jgi:hypothetical protein
VTGLSLFLGVPGRTLAILPSWPTRSTTPIDQVAAKMVRPTDVVFCSYKVYYSVRPHARLVYAYGSFVVEFLKNFPAQDFSLLCLAPDEVDSAMKIVGGHWEKVPLEQMPEAAALGRTRYAVDFYRRSSN